MPSRQQHRGTRTPAGLPPSGGPQPAVRYETSPAWPGITGGHDARCSCTWAMHRGVYQVKVRDAICANHIRAVSR